MILDSPGSDELLKLWCNLLRTDVSQPANCDGCAQGCERISVTATSGQTHTWKHNHECVRTCVFKQGFRCVGSIDDLHQMGQH